jgi:hypothetical protein
MSLPFSGEFDEWPRWRTWNRLDIRENPPGNAALHAYDASNVAQELCKSNQSGNRDHFGAVVKFVVLTIANGRVYIGGKGHLVVFGLLP